MRILSSLLLTALSCLSQPVPQAVTFGWDRPSDMAGIVAYELQWGSGFAVLNTNLLRYTVNNLPLGFTNEVSIRSIGASGLNSDSVTIQVFNVVINLEQNFGDGWKVLTNMPVTVQIDKAHSLFRARIDTK